MKASILIALALAGCGSAVVRDRPVTVNIPVAVPCVSERPVRPATFEQVAPAWSDMDVRQKAAATGLWALAWVNYGQQLEAATAGCGGAE